jgi:hypothetical protein
MHYPTPLMRRRNMRMSMGYNAKRKGAYYRILGRRITSHERERQR